MLIEELKINDKIIYNVGNGALIVCLEDDITTDIVERLANYIKENVLFDENKQKLYTRVVFKDKSFKDSVAKTNAMQILKQNGIDEVVSV